MHKIQGSFHRSLMAAENELFSSLHSKSNQNSFILFSKSFERKMQQMILKQKQPNKVLHTISNAAACFLAFVLLLSLFIRFEPKNDLFADAQHPYDLQVEDSQATPGFYFHYHNYAPAKNSAYLTPPNSAIEQEYPFLNPTELVVEKIEYPNSIWHNDSYLQVHYKDAKTDNLVARLDRNALTHGGKNTEYITEEKSERFYTKVKFTQINGYKALQSEGITEVCWVWRDEYFFYSFVVDLKDGVLQYPIEKAIAFIDNSGTVHHGSFINCIDEDYTLIGRTKEGEKIYKDLA